MLAQSYYPDGGEINMSKALRFLRGAPRKHIIMPPEAVKAAIITCGGLCPGLNAVIRDLVMTLFYNYGVREIYGVTSGYRGFYTPNSYRKLDPNVVQDIHELGGTIIKSSRGGWDLKRIADGIEEAGFNQIYILGGDGTHRGIKELVNEFERRGTSIWISGISKTIDNDIPVIDKSFGFETSVEEAQRAINSANVEANSVDYGIGLVKLMGRNSGFIAMHASIANGNVNICLVPEWKYELHGEKGVLAHILRRLKHKNHCVIVVAEGAASACLDEKLQSQGTDPSGNPILYDIGSYLKKEIVKYCQANGVDATLKYIDPTYMIRTVQANSHDKILCTTLAMAAVHGTFAGFTGFSVGVVAGQPVYIPVEVLTTVQEGIGSKPGQRTIDTEKNPNWWRLIASTGQPSFRN